MTRELEDMHAMAQRQLDGMTVNRDLMAKDVLFLLALVARYQTQLERSTKAFQDMQKVMPQDAGIASAFNDIFGDILKTTTTKPPAT